MDKTPMKSLFASLIAFYQSSIGKKILVAITGLAMLLFLVGHLTGNLLIFKGPVALNGYAKWLHSLGGLLWVARIGLIVALVVHVVATIQLVRANRAARPQAYGKQETRKASGASRTMIWSGVIILSFIIFHLLHFTFGVQNGFYDESKARYFVNGEHQVFNMVVDGFKSWGVSGFYILSMGLLCLHLSHGFASVFQTLGLTTPGTRGAIELAGRAYALVIFLGNCSIPLAVLLGLVH